MKRTLRFVGTIAIVAGCLLAGVATVMAEGPQAGDRPARDQGLPGRSARGIAQSEAIAEALGMTTDELQEALDDDDDTCLADLAEEADVDLADLYEAYQAERLQARLTSLDEAVDSGDIDQDYADWYRKGLTEGFVSASVSGLRGGTNVETLAEVLGMDADEVQLQLWAGRTVEELADQAGIDADDLEAALEQARQEAAIARIEQAVEDGEMSKAEGAWRIEGIENGFEASGRLGMPMLSGQSDSSVPGVRGGQAPASR